MVTATFVVFVSYVIATSVSLSSFLLNKIARNNCASKPSNIMKYKLYCYMLSFVRAVKKYFCKICTLFVSLKFWLSLSKEL